MVIRQMRRDRFLFSTEEECLTASPGNPKLASRLIEQFLATARRQAPSLPGPSGYFNAYGRVYSDIEHIELAATECDDPYLLANVVERQHMLVARAVAEMDKQGRHFLLANNNHSGLLQPGCPVWGAHENYLTEQHPSQFGDRILPFLVTRIYAGAGGVLFPGGDFLAGSRPVCMELTTGGGTTSHRAMHSTARDEHHMGSSNSCYRYHQIGGDGHRSHFNLALQFGATALALKAVIFDEQLPSQLAELTEFPPPNGDWVAMLRQFNVLAKPGQPLCVDPLVVKTQRVYLEATRRFVATLDNVEPWILRLLDDWQQTLDALEQMDLAWLSARLDSFIKYELYTNFLQQEGVSWQELPNNQELFNRLALLDHSYHEFCNPDSVFRRLEKAGVLAHRVGDVPEPGCELEPYVVETTTRARARARFIRDHQNESRLLVDWSCVRDMNDGSWLELFDPFAESYGEWQNGEPKRRRRRETRRTREQEILVQVLAAYERGEYETAHRHLRRIERFDDAIDDDSRTMVYRYRAWLQARRGYTDAPEWLARVYGTEMQDLAPITDCCCAHRFGGLMPDVGIEPYVARGREILDELAETSNEPLALALREHIAYSLLRNGDAEAALEILDVAHGRRSQGESRIFGRILATLGDIYRVLGNRRKSRQLLRDALSLQTANEFNGDRADFTLTYLAKLEASRRQAIEWIQEAMQVQTATSNRVGLTRSWVLQARLSNNDEIAAQNRRAILANQQSVPALSQCRRLALVLDNWERWVGQEMIDGFSDPFWGV